MGQRLNLEIKKKGRTLASAYYHWSAYTKSSFMLTSEVIMYLRANKNIIKDERLLAIRALESTGAGVPDWEEGVSELKRLKDIRKYSTMEFAQFKDRNEGIISCFPDSIKEREDWANGVVTIDLDSLDILFDVFCFYDSVDEIKDWYEDFKEEEVVIFNYDFDHLSLGELSDIVSTVCSGKWVNIDGQYISELG